MLPLALPTKVTVVVAVPFEQELTSVDTVTVKSQSTVREVADV